MKNFKNLESIKKIKEYQQAAENPSFSFKVISGEEVMPLKTLPMNKSTASGDIPTKILKQHAQISSIVIEVIRTVLFFYEKILSI